MIFTTENFLKDNADKIPADKKPAVEQALQQLRDAHKSGDVNAIDTATTALNSAVQAASAQMYQGAQGGAQTNGAQGAYQGFQGEPKAEASQNSDTSKDNIQDADFEEVK